MFNLITNLRIQESNNAAATNGNKRKPSISLGQEQDQDDWRQAGDGDTSQEQEPEHLDQGSQAFHSGSTWEHDQEPINRHHSGALNIRYEDKMLHSFIRFIYSLSEIIKMAIASEYEMMPGPPLAILNDREQSRLHELFVASRSLAETIGEEEDLSFNKFNAEPSLIR